MEKEIDQRMKTPPERQVVTVYDDPQHCTSRRQPDGNTVSMDCPYTGKGEEFSPTNLVEAALSGCMLIAMGTLALRNGINLIDTQVVVNIKSTDKPRIRFKSIDIQITMPSGLSEVDRKKLERAAEGCPIKHSFASDIPLYVKYAYPS